MANTSARRRRHVRRSRYQDCRRMFWWRSMSSHWSRKMKVGRSFSIVLALAAAVFAQTAAHKPATPRPPSTNAPTKVTGDGVKTSSGLQYWDIKAGTGAEAQTGQKVKVHYTG